MSGPPALMLYTGDWLKDPALGKCSPATRGIWIDMLCAMHENGRSGKLEGTYDQLSRILRCSPVEVQEACYELGVTKTSLVTERNGLVTILNKRMLREHKGRQSNAKRQKRYRERQQDNAGVTPLKRDSSSSSSSSSSEKRRTTPKKESAKTPNAQQARVERILEIMPMQPPRAAKLLKQWEKKGEEACLEALRSAVEHFPAQNENYILQVMGSALKNGGQVAMGPTGKPAKTHIGQRAHRDPSKRKYKRQELET